MYQLPEAPQWPKTTYIHFVVLPMARHVKSRHWQSQFLLEASPRKVLFCGPIGIRWLNHHLGFLWLVEAHSSFHSFSHYIFSGLFCFSSLLRILVFRFRVLPTSA